MQNSLKTVLLEWSWTAQYDKPLLDSNRNIYYVDNDMEDDYISIGRYVFPEITFDNSPQQVELKLVK